MKKEQLFATSHFEMSFRKVSTFTNNKWAGWHFIKLILMPAIENHDLNNFTVISLSVGFKLECTK